VAVNKFSLPPPLPHLPGNPSSLATRHFSRRHHLATSPLATSLIALKVDHGVVGHDLDRISISCEMEDEHYSPTHVDCSVHYLPVEDLNVKSEQVRSIFPIDDLAGNPHDSAAALSWPVSVIKSSVPFFFSFVMGVD